MFKLVLIGDTSVGKTNLLLRYTKDEFSHSQQATVGAEISSKRLVLKSQGGQDKVIKTHFWDTAGQEQFKSISSQFYKAASGVVFIYDITRKDTFHNVNHWLQEVKDYADANIIRLLVIYIYILIYIIIVITQNGWLLAQDPPSTSSPQQHT